MSQNSQSEGEAAPSDIVSAEMVCRSLQKTAPLWPEEVWDPRVCVPARISEWDYFLGLRWSAPVGCLNCSAWLLMVVVLPVGCWDG